MYACNDCLISYVYWVATKLRKRRESKIVMFLVFWPYEGNEEINPIKGRNCVNVSSLMGYTWEDMLDSIFLNFVRPYFYSLYVSSATKRVWKGMGSHLL